MKKNGEVDREAFWFFVSKNAEYKVETAESTIGQNANA